MNTVQGVNSYFRLRRVIAATVFSLVLALNSLAILWILFSNAGEMNLVPAWALNLIVAGGTIIMFLAGIYLACRQYYNGIPLGIIIMIGILSVPAMLILRIVIPLLYVFSISLIEIPAHEHVVISDRKINPIAIVDPVNYSIGMRVRKEDAETVRKYYLDRFAERGWKKLSEKSLEHPSENRKVSINVEFWHWEDPSMNNCKNNICSGDDRYRRIRVYSPWY